MGVFKRRFLAGPSSMIGENAGNQIRQRMVELIKLEAANMWHMPRMIMWHMLANPSRYITFANPPQFCLLINHSVPDFA